MYWTSPDFRFGWCRRTAKNGWQLQGSTQKSMAFRSYRQKKKSLKMRAIYEKNIGSAPAVLIGNFRRRILCIHFSPMGVNVRIRSPVKLAKTASAVKASFAGAGVQRAASPLCRGAGAAAHCWGQGATPIGGLRAASLIGSRVKRLAQGKLMPASTCTGYYLTQNFAGLAALPALPSPEHL